jgi:hypothetical protein
MPRKKRDQPHLHVVGDDEVKTTRKKRDYENDIPAAIDLEADSDYSVLLAEADSVRAKAALDVQKYHAVRETIERVNRVNEMLRAANGSV